ncbi:hypothetical protein [Xanthomonas sp. BRIP62409]|uniref:hypothetical protein n=1 Tax=Xanthomonas sp. BRIP62409 TaxID=2182388 RepID=UPI000F8F4E0A|nr:hypothetical protein [Xanthomonas sp. BRIP62409]
MTVGVRQVLRKEISVETSVVVTLEAAFAGFTFLPWIAWAHNSLNPTLILHAERVEYRVLRTRTRPYADVALVDYRKTHGTENIVLAFHGSKTTFIANTGLLRRTREAIHLLHQRGCPLSDRARALISPGSSNDTHNPSR